MERRRFLKNLVLGAVSASVSVKLLTEAATPIIKGKQILDSGYVYAPYIPLQETQWEIDYVTKNIKYKGDINSRYTLYDFYSFLREEWDDKKGEFPLLT